MANDRPTGGEGGSGPRLGGARADFVGSLGRKIADLRAVLATLAGEPESSLARDDLRRKLHALGTGARMLHFEGMTRCILDTESLLERGMQEGGLRAADFDRVEKALDELPSLAWSEERPLDGPATLPPESRPRPLAPPAASVLVIGYDDLAEMLVEEIGAEGGEFDCERLEDLSKARSVALAVAPDVIVVDGDLGGAADRIAELLDDPLTEGTPLIVAIGGKSENLNRFRALGVAKILLRPLLPGALRAACQEALDQRDGKTLRMTLGEPTVAELGERLALEVRHALVDSVDEPARGTRVALGDGTEVWGALWGAIARVREVITTQTRGSVQFTGHGPEGALALAPVLTRAGGASDRSVDGGRDRNKAVDVSLVGRRAIVADDDPAVTWFIADLLRTAGCVVHEALDGRTALRMAYEISPELVVSDILMPGLDGFALCRALRRDVALRDTPVILLSWKEDLLQRVRELGASAAAYLRKESDARAILARVREVMRPRARIAARLRGTGEVRGRLDGLTVRSLLELVLSARPAARVSVRDASFLYEVELFGGGINKASRTAGDGTFLRGDHVIAAMLGVGAGRFVVSPTRGGPGAAKPAPLAEQFARPIGLARSALHATTGARMMNVAKMVLDEDDVAGYLLATPEPARELVRRLARGQSPREILLGGEVSPALVEDVLSDLATRGAVVAVYRADGSDAMRGEAFDPRAIMSEDIDREVPPASSRRGGRLAATASAATAVPFAAPAARPYDDASIPITVEAAATPAATAAAPPTAALPPPSTTAPPASRGSAPREPGRIATPEGNGAPVSPPPKDAPRGLGPVALIVGLALAVAGGRAVMSAREAPRAARPPVEAPGVTDEPLPAGKVPDGQGLLRVRVAIGATVRIDGKDAPSTRDGNVIAAPVQPGVHLLSVGTGEKARSRIVEVRAGRATSVALDEP